MEVFYSGTSKVYYSFICRRDHGSVCRAGAVQSVYAESIPYTARTSLEDFYVPSDRTVYQLVLYDFCTAVLLFYRIIVGTGLGKFPIYHVLYDFR